MKQTTLNDISLLDFISLLEIYRSRQKEKESDEFTNQLIHALADEVQKLHKENEEILKEIKVIKELLPISYWGNAYQVEPKVKTVLL